MEPNTLSIIGILVGVGGLVVAYIQSHDKKRLEQYARGHLGRHAGNIEWVKVGTAWAHQHSQRIHDLALDLERTPEVKEILSHAQSGTGDTVAAGDLFKNLLNEALAIQGGLFGTDDIIHPDRAIKDKGD